VGAFSLSGLVLVITGIVLLVIILMSGKTRLHYMWGVFNVAVMIWGTSVFFIGRSEDPVTSEYWWKIAHIGVILIPVFFYHVVRLLCGLPEKKILLYIYIQGVVFLVLNVLDINDLFLSKMKFVFNSFYYFTPGKLYHVFLASWVAIVSYGIIMLFISYRKSSGIRKNQYALFLAGLCAGFSGGLTNFFPAYGVNLYPFGNFGIPVYCIIATYSILRYRLMDIHLVIKKGMVYSLSAGILTSLFVVLVITLTKYLSDVTGGMSFVITIISALTIAVLFNPLKNRVQRIIDKTFYKRSYDFYKVIRNVSRSLSAIFESEKIYRFVADTIYETLGLSRMLVLTGTPDGYRMVYQTLPRGAQKKYADSVEELHISNNSELIRFLITSREVLIKDELPAFEQKIGQDGIERIKNEFAPFHGEAAVPIFIEGQLSLILILGEKLAGDMFTTEDINLLKTVSDQTAISVKNARLYKDNLDSEKLASIGMMAATFAHEVRNPLTSLKTFAQLMPEKYNDEEFRNGFSKIVVGEIQKIDDLISDLLDFSTEKKSARVTEYDLVGIVDETIDYIKGKLGLARRNIVIEKNYDRESVMMIGDVKQLRQLFTNLVTNGCQAMNSEGILRVEIHPDGDTVSVVITDTGKGIHPDDIQKIFDPFVTNKETGTGLGLPISKKIVEEHNGSLNVTSRLSEGSTFTVTLPVQKE
jgi:two-component system NtrC family sensor kinase